MNTVPSIRLNNGVQIPQLGIGVFKVEPAQTAETVRYALDVGYRHIDTAEMYGNEREVGRAVRESGIAREEVFVTSKLDNDRHEHDAALEAFDRSLADLGFDYLDLFLIHWPLPKVGDFAETWRALEEIYASGRVRAIGVSNFQPHHLRRLLEQTTIVPAVNQIEVHPYLTQDVARASNAEHGIATEAWAPLARGKELLDDRVVTRIAQRLGRTPAQVVLRWHIQRGDIVFPKSVTPARIAENFALFDFVLEDDDVIDISGLNRDERTGPDPDKFNYVH